MNWVNFCRMSCHYRSVLSQQTVFSFYVICDQAQKELLDAELDFHKKMSSGEDTTDLKRKLGQLQVEVMHKHTQCITTDQSSEMIACTATSRSIKAHLTQAHTEIDSENIKDFLEG